MDTFFASIKMQKNGYTLQIFQPYHIGFVRYRGHKLGAVWINVQCDQIGLFLKSLDNK